MSHPYRTAAPPLGKRWGATRWVRFITWRRRMMRRLERDKRALARIRALALLDVSGPDSTPYSAPFAQRFHEVKLTDDGQQYWFYWDRYDTIIVPGSGAPRPK